MRAIVLTIGNVISKIGMAIYDFVLVMFGTLLLILALFFFTFFHKE